MKNFEVKKEIWIWAIMVLPIAYLYYVWPTLPETVPTHFGIDGKPNGWSSKTSFMYMVPGLVVGMYVLFTIIPLIDPKGRLNGMGGKYFLLKLLLMLFMSGLSFFIIQSALSTTIMSEKILMMGVGALFVFLGNYMQTVKPNYFIGIRTPWTLESETVWRNTHALGGKLYLVAGLLTMILPFVLKDAFYPVFLGVVLTASFIPIIYSFVLFRKEKAGN